jgi:lipoprotein-releasing system permease protein
VQEKQPEKAIISEEFPIFKRDKLTDTLRKLPGIQSVHAFATKYAILKTRDEIEGVLLKGFNREYNPANFKPFMKQGRFINFNDSTYSREIILSEYTAKQLQLKLNDRILIYFIRPDGRIRPDKLTITGIYKTGIEEYDKTFAVGDIKLIQRLNDWEPDEIGGYEIFLKDPRRIDEMVNTIYQMDSTYFPDTWDTLSVRNISPNIFDWLNMQDVTRDVLIAFMIIVAVINLITCLIILVLERVRLIGIFKSLGATDWMVQKIFLRHSALITITGIVAGTVLALALLWLQQATGFIKLKEEAYFLSTAAVKIVWWQVAAVCVGTLVICFLVLMIPSILVRKIQPVKAIQFR